MEEQRKKTELLAPAKDKETAFAAIDCGADAVYIGASSFGARHNASNSIDDIKEVVNYAHKYWAKVFVTVNTILTDNELRQATKLVTELDRIGVDAILIQDMGLLYEVMSLNLSIPIHASTQCDNRDEEKIKFFEKVGLSRVVLARELSLDKINQIHKTNPNIELEAFIHGALCVSYSGQCYLSQFIGGRSANRGECAQPCRKKYKVFDTTGKEYNYPYPLCLKDFNASKHIKEMIDCGVYSFKIEGRLKDIGYVKNAVAFYRQLLDKYSDKISSGKSVYPFVPDVEKSFNRGFTDYFLSKRTDCYNPISPKSLGKYIGTVSCTKQNKIILTAKTDINVQDGICFINNDKLEGFLVNKTELSQNKTVIYPNKQIQLKAGTKLYRNSDIQFEKELLKPVKRQIGVNITVRDNRIILTDENNIKVEVNIGSTEPAINKNKMNDTFIKQFYKTGESDFYISNMEIESEIPFMQISEINNLRREAFDKLMKKRLSSYKRDIQKQMNFTEYYKKEVDYKANVHNNKAAAFYEKCNSKVKEWSLETKLPARQAELMRGKHCIKYALNICKSDKNLILQDEKGIKYPLKFDCKNCEMVVLSPTEY